VNQEKDPMGLEQTVTFTEGSLPPWDEVGALLARRGFPVQVRMIDDQLAFPDERPPATWRELRLGTPQGMVTLRRASDRVVVVTWGNADAGLRRAWNALAWALAEATGGLVQSPGGSLSAAAFLRGADLPFAVSGNS
jgi:hypothetical protein